MREKTMLDLAHTCQSKEQAAELVKKWTDEVMDSMPHLLREEARRMVMDGLGYQTVYVDREAAERVQQLFGCRHPYLGAVEDWPRTSEETLALGMKLGQRVARGEEVKF